MKNEVMTETETGAGVPPSPYSKNYQNHSHLPAWDSSEQDIEEVIPDASREYSAIESFNCKLQTRFEKFELIYDVETKYFVHTENPETILGKSVQSVEKRANNQKKSLAQMTTEEIKMLPSFPKGLEYRPLAPPASLTDPIFDSHFECGNLRQVYRILPGEYLLFLNSDSGTKSHSQWFFFSVAVQAKQELRFHIVNLSKSETLYKDGMKPCVYSCRGNDLDNSLGWIREGSNVLYRKNSDFSHKWPVDLNQSTLSFSYCFEHENDCVYFSDCFPYSYSRLSNWLNCLKAEHPHLLISSRLCYTLRGLSCPVLLITSEPLQFCRSQLQKVTAFKKYSTNKTGEVKLSNKKIFFITCRVHPGETNSSYELEGLVEFLLSGDSKAVQLRSKYAFCIVPMLNPDGVVNGNYRCSSSGMDLNRTWQDPNKVLQPTIFYSKQLMRELSETGMLFSYIDLHGHSAKRNVFLFGCQVNSSDLEHKEKNRKIRLFPYLMAKLNKAFSVYLCKFNLDKQKEGTGRGVAFKEFGVELSYTIETSFHGIDMISLEQPRRSSMATFDRRVNQGSFTINVLKTIGKDICLGFLILQKAIELNEKEPKITLQRKKFDEIMNSFLKNSSLTKTIQRNNQGKDITHCPYCPRAGC